MWSWRRVDGSDVAVAAEVMVMAVGCGGCWKKETLTITALCHGVIVFYAKCMEESEVKIRAR